MAKTTKKTESKGFKEFNLECSNGNTFSGRLYPVSSTTENAEISPLSIVVNGLAIVGSKFIDGKNGAFVSFPSYKTKNGEYKSQCYFYNKDDMADMTELSDYLLKLKVD